MNKSLPKLYPNFPQLVSSHICFVFMFCVFVFKSTTNIQNKTEKLRLGISLMSVNTMIDGL